jgi:hypothetical protein
VYLFCTVGAALVPFEYRTENIFYPNALYTQTVAHPGTYESPSELDSFSASPVDAPDGLTGQFRIEAGFSAVPPGAVEEAPLRLMFRSGKNSSDEIYRLRLHSARQFHDFRFRVAINYEPEPKTKVESAGTKAGS